MLDFILDFTATILSLILTVLSYLVNSLLGFLIGITVGAFFIILAKESLLGLFLTFGIVLSAKEFVLIYGLIGSIVGFSRTSALFANLNMEDYNYEE